MDMKRAIKFLRNHFKIGIYEKISKEIIALIKQLDKKSIRGEKFEAMWKELLRDTYYFPTRMVMANIKQKYFPKPSDNFTEKVMDKINNEGGK